MARMTRKARLDHIDDLMVAAEIRLKSYADNTEHFVSPERDLNLAAEYATQAQVHALLLIAGSLEGRGVK